MAGVSISHLIIFIASLLIASAVVGAAFTGVDQFNNAMEDRSITAAEQIRTDITIISDPASNAIYNDEEVTVLLKNTGQMNLIADERQLNVLLNGEYVTSDRLTAELPDHEGHSWRTSYILELTIDTDGLDPGDHRVTVTVNSAQADLNFRVEDED